MRSVIVIIALIIGWSRLPCGDQPAEFRLSEWPRSTALSSAQYRAMIDEAIVEYQRNCVESSNWVVCTERLSSRDIFFPPIPPEFRYDPSAFLAEPLSLRITSRPEDFGFTRQ